MQGEWELEEGITYLPKQPKRISYQTQRMIEMIPDIAKYGLDAETKAKVGYKGLVILVILFQEF